MSGCPRDQLLQRAKEFWVTTALGMGQHMVKNLGARDHKLRSHGSGRGELQGGPTLRKGTQLRVGAEGGNAGGSRGLEEL